MLNNTREQLNKITKIRISDSINGIEEELYIFKSQYHNNKTTAVVLYDIEEFEPYLDITTNVDNAEDFLAEDEILVKTWSENENFIQSMLESGYFEDTGKTIPTGFVTASIWKVKKDISDMDQLSPHNPFNSEKN